MLHQFSLHGVRVDVLQFLSKFLPAPHVEIVKSLLPESLQPGPGGPGLVLETTSGAPFAVFASGDFVFLL